MEEELNGSWPIETDFFRPCMGGLPALAKDRKKILRRINALNKDIKRNPSEGIGKPEPLNMYFQGTGPAAKMMSIE